MSVFLKAVAYALLCLLLGVVLRELGFRGARLVGLIGTVALLGASVSCIGEVLTALPAVGDGGREYAVAILKMVGVGYAFGICSDACRELGEGSLAGAVCLFGRVQILILSLPFIKRIIERGVELI